MLKKEDKVYVINIMEDVKNTTNSISSATIIDNEDLLLKLRVNFYRIADAITKIVNE